MYMRGENPNNDFLITLKIFEYLSSEHRSAILE
jgi:hypothetical protein